MAIKSALYYLGPEWSSQFQKRWDNQRITKNTQGGVIMTFDNLVQALGETHSLDMPSKVKPAIDKLKDQMDMVKQLRNEGKNKESSEILATICRKIIEDFDIKKFPKEIVESLESEESRTPPLYQQEFILRLYYKLFQGGTIWDTKISTLLFSIDSKIKDKEYERLFPFLKAIIEYDDIDFEGILNRIDRLEEEEIKPRIKDNANLEAMQYAVWKVFLKAKDIPAERLGSISDSNQGQRRDDLPTEGQVARARKYDLDLYKPVEVDPELLKKTKLVMDQVTEEIINGIPIEDSLLSKIFFRHSTNLEERRAPLTLDYLKSMTL